MLKLLVGRENQAVQQLSKVLNSPAKTINLDQTTEFITFVVKTALFSRLSSGLV
jgi:hypothetical protein